MTYISDESYERLGAEVLKVLNTHDRWLPAGSIAGMVGKVHREEVTNPETGKVKTLEIVTWASDTSEVVPEELVYRRYGYVPIVDAARVRTALARLIRAGLVEQRKGDPIGRRKYERLYQTRINAARIEEQRKQAANRNERMRRAQTEQLERAVEVLEAAGFGVDRIIAIQNRIELANPKIEEDQE